MATLKIKVRPGKCQGHARCYALAPDIFDLDDEGFVNFTERVISKGEEEAARTGVKACPERALTIVEE